MAVLSGWILSCSEPAARDPLSGRWRLQRSATHYGGNATPRADEEFNCALDGARVACTITGAREDGTVITGSFNATYDGQTSSVTGIPGVDRVSLRRVSATSADATFSNGPRPVFGYRTFKGSDGKTLIIVSVEPVTRRVLNSVVVYTRE